MLWSVPASGGDAVPLTAAALEANRPVHSPDGASVAFCAFGSGTYHVWTMRPDGTGLRQRTEGPFDHRGPAWSPDGTRLAFASERAGDPVGGAPYRIHVLELASGAVTRMTGRAGQDGPLQGGAWEDFDPTWSPDGERILFVRATVTAAATGPRADARTIASVPADGSGPVTVAFTEQEPAAQLLAPAVAPDGRRTAWLRTTPPPKPPASSSSTAGRSPSPGMSQPSRRVGRPPGSCWSRSTAGSPSSGRSSRRRSGRSPSAHGWRRTVRATGPSSTTSAAKAACARSGAFIFPHCPLTDGTSPSPP